MVFSELCPACQGFPDERHRLDVSCRVLQAPGLPQEGTNVCSPAQDMGESAGSE
jgi:hypothetical protein